MITGNDYMFSNITNILHPNISNDEINNRRQSPRRPADDCIGVIRGKSYPIRDWSNGGVLLGGNEKTIGENDNIKLTMRFRLTDNKIMDITHRGTVIRKGKDRFAVKFAPLTNDIEAQFKKVINDYSARQFADSQAV